MKKLIWIISILLFLLATGFLLKCSQQQKHVDGIDISHHNRVTDWNKVNVGFIYAKATEGKSHRDTKYKSYRHNAMKRNIPFGAYHFLSTDIPAKQQFQNFKNVVPKGSTTLIPMLDVEDVFNNSRSKIQAIVGEWIELCHDYYGSYPIVYCSPQFVYHIYLMGTPNISKCLFWVGDIHTSFLPLKSGKIVQFKIDKLDGFEGGIDCNYLNGSLDELMIK